MHEVVCAQISASLQSKGWRCQYSSAYIAVAVTWLRQEDRRVCETRAESCHAKWWGLCKRNLAILMSRFLGAFAKLWKAFISFVMSVSLSVRPMEQFGSQQADFHEIFYLIIFRKSLERIQVSLKSDRNNGYFTQRSMYIYDSISLYSS